MSDPDLADSATIETSEAAAALDALTRILAWSPAAAGLSSSSSLLHDAGVSSSISGLLVDSPTSGSGDNPLCRWLYDAFQSRDPALRLVALSYVPLLSGLYLERVSSRRHHTSGFEAVLLSLYSRETASRPERTPLSVTIPKLSNPSLYHHPVSPSSAPATDLHVGTQSDALEPHSTLRATSRVRVVGVALEVFYSFIGSMPLRSKLDFCHSCQGWAQDSASGLPWELMQPALRILGHCLIMPDHEFLHHKARAASKSLYTRALHGIDSNAILATRSLIRMIHLQIGVENEFDYTDLPLTSFISI